MATAALVKETQRADLVVVGARGTGGFEGLLVGSTTNGLVERASGPVAVVGAPGPVAGGRVVVGIDGSVRSTTALRWAAEEAKARRAPLDVVHAWKFPTLDPGDWMPSLPTEDEARQRAEDLLTASLADPALSGVEATRHLSAGGAAHALLERCEGAGLVVVGARDLGPVAGWFLGSVSRQLLHHAPCPVVLL